jgi:hypothetical protein
VAKKTSKAVPKKQAAALKKQETPKIDDSATDMPLPVKTRWIRIKEGSRIGCRYCGLTIGKTTKHLHDYEAISEDLINYQIPPKKPGHCPKCSTTFQQDKQLWTDKGWR